MICVNIFIGELHRHERIDGTFLRYLCFYCLFEGVKFSFFLLLVNDSLQTKVVLIAWLNLLSGDPATGPSPLEIIATKPASHIDDFANKK